MIVRPLKDAARVVRIRFFSVVFPAIVLAFVLPLIAETTETRRHVAVVAPKVFHRSLGPWVRYRADQGYAVHLIVPSADGKSIDPRTIKDEIRTLAEQVSLEALLLVGPGVRRNGDQDDRMVPSPRFSCRIIQRFGPETHYPSDDWYADLDEDGLPDFDVGRFAVETIGELDLWIQKTIRYENATPCDVWCRQLQVVAGLGNFSPLLDHAIESASRYILAETIPDSWDIRFLHASWRSPFCPSLHDYREELAASLRKGSLFWVYLGHGHHRMLDPIATPFGSIESLHADRLPDLTSPGDRSIAILFCCYGGVLDASTRSLAEELVRQPGGPVAVLAAPRTTMPYGMGILGIEILQQLLERCDDGMSDPITFGSIVRKAKRQMLRMPEQIDPDRSPLHRRSARESLTTLAGLLDPTADVLRVQLEEHAALFHLFGDPLLLLPSVRNLEIQCPNRAASGSRLRIEGTLSDRDFPGTVRLELFLPARRSSLNSPRRTELRFDPETRIKDNEEYRQANDRVVARSQAELRDGSFSAEIEIPAGLRGEYVLRACAFKENRCYLGGRTIRVLPGKKAEKTRP